MDLRNLIDCIDAVSISNNATITQLKHEEDDELYQVWRIDTEYAVYILKEAKENEKEIYDTFLGELKGSAPALYQSVTMDGKNYLLLEYVEGENLCKCNRAKLTRALDALISLQRKTWGSEAESFDKSIAGRRDRGRYLNDPLLEKAYEKFLRVYRSAPGSLCHDDLLPFNIIASEERATLIDWECGGVLPYPTSFARLIAHAEESEDALFYMTEADKCFAIEYYYDNLLKEKGISYMSWRNTLECFLFYEYCEWVFVGNKYHATDGEYYKKYLPMAKKQAAKIMEIEI